MKWLSFIFGEQVYKLNSLIVTWIFRWRGVSVGSGLYIQGVPKLKIKGRAQDIILGDTRIIHIRGYRNPIESL